MADMDTFVAISAALTGIDPGKLAPGVDPIKVSAEYFQKASTEAPDVFKRVLSIASATPPPANLADALLNGSGDDVRFLCRSIMLMWFLGSWFNPNDLKLYASAIPPAAPISSSVVSSKAYTQGWVWAAAQAHPMGYSTLRFGYWNQPPVALNDFIGA